MSRRADICGATWRGMERRTTTSVSTSRRRFAMRRRVGVRRRGRCWKGCSASGRQIKPGEAIPAEWGGGVNKWPWAIPLVAKNIATKPELVGHFAPEQPDFNLRVPDQIRVEVFLRHFKGWVADREAGKDTMPNFIMLRFGERPYCGDDSGWAYAEVFGCGQRSRDWAGGGGGVALALLGRYGVLHSGG